jgi:hypothetical protein
MAVLVYSFITLLSINSFANFSDVKTAINPNVEKSGFIEKPLPLPVPSGLKNESPLVFFWTIGDLPILPKACHLFFIPEY